MKGLRANGTTAQYWARFGELCAPCPQGACKGEVYSSSQHRFLRVDLDISLGSNPAPSVLPGVLGERELLTGDRALQSIPSGGGQRRCSAERYLGRDWGSGSRTALIPALSTPGFVH